MKFMSKVTRNLCILLLTTGCGFRLDWQPKQTTNSTNVTTSLPSIVESPIDKEAASDEVLKVIDFFDNFMSNLKNVNKYQLVMDSIDETDYSYDLFATQFYNIYSMNPSISIESGIGKVDENGKVLEPSKAMQGKPLILWNQFMDSKYTVQKVYDIEINQTSFYAIEIFSTITNYPQIANQRMHQHFNESPIHIADRVFSREYGQNDSQLKEFQSSLLEIDLKAVEDSTTTHQEIVTILVTNDLKMVYDVHHRYEKVGITPLINYLQMLYPCHFHEGYKVSAAPYYLEFQKRFSENSNDYSSKKNP